MEELIQQYIEESTALVDKQAGQIENLTGKTVHLEKELAEEREKRLQEGKDRLDKQAAENTLDEITNLLNNERYTQESIVNAIREKDANRLEKQALDSDLESEEWGELDGGSANSSNIRPSVQKLYSNLGLV